MSNKPKKKSRREIRQHKENEELFSQLLEFKAELRRQREAAGTLGEFSAYPSAFVR